MSTTQVTIRDLRPGDEAAFRRLNEEWIRRDFAMELKDEASLADPWTSIVNPGGRVFLAFVGAEAVGCCALLAMGPGGFEVAKMAVAPAFQRAGIGRQLLEWTIATARTLGVRRLYLETNRKLTPAIRLYEKLGFRHVPAERRVPSPYARSNVSMELYLEPGD